MFSFIRPQLPAAERPVTYTVLKDGAPFAVLNACPALAKRTVAGFAKATPEAAWDLRPAA